MTKIEIQRTALAKNTTLVERVEKMRSKDPNLTIDEACQRANWTYSQYYSTLKKLGRSPGLTKSGVDTKKINYPKTRKSPAKLTVTEIVSPTKGGGAFMIFGSPEALASFARAYE